MGNLMGCLPRSNNTSDVSPSPVIPTPSSIGISERYTSGKGFSVSDTSSSGNSGYSFGDHPSFGGEILEASGDLLEKPNLRVFSVTELKNATRGFRPDTVLGEGGFGKVYKGSIDEKVSVPSKSGSKMIVAIKKLNSESLQGFEEWQSEVNFLGRLSHPNLVKLLGYCWEDQDLLLVYEYLSKGSLENHLFRRIANMEPLSWDKRMSIALGVAKGLAFLHTSEQVIYRDFKAANILLDANYNAKLSDFGLAKLGPPAGKSHVTTRVMGTYGYAAPEYVATGHLYVNSDVYGFGVVMLEMLTGLRALDLNRPNGQQNLVEWAKPCLSSKSRLKTIMDRRLEGQYSIKAAYELAQLILKCLIPDPRVRCSMKEVVLVLEKIEPIKEKPKQKRTNNERSSSDRQSGHNRRSPYHQKTVGSLSR